MAVKAGYKQTEVGVIPENWNVITLEEACRAKISYGIVQCGPHIKNGIPYIRVSDMDRPELDDALMLRTSLSIAAKFPRSTVEEGDLVYALRGRLGEVRQVKGAIVGANLTQGTARISPKEGITSDFMLWTMRNPSTLRQAEVEAKGSTFREITLADLRRIKIFVPPLLEQQAIAEALSDVDALIESLEQLIVKKRDLKQAAMQELLTGKKRLEGFSEEWEVKRLGEVAEFINGRAYELSEWKTSGTPVIRLQNLTGGENYYYSTLELPQRQYCDFGDLLYMWSATFGPRLWQGGKAIFHYHIWKIEVSPLKLDKFFLYYSLDELTERLKRYSSRGGTMLHVTKNSMEKTELLLPPTLLEQQAIATILSDMDTEIASLEQRQGKTKMLKQGMMQELLTGRIRLI